MIRSVSALIQTLFDIMRLRKGPDAIPRSQVLFVIVLLVWLVAGALATAVVGEIPINRLFLGWFVSFGGLAIYASIVSLYGKSERLLQMLTAVLGCGFLFTIIISLLEIIGIQLLGAESGSPLLTTIVLLIWFIYAWSIIVEGFILSVTISQPRFVGTMIALAVFILQLYLLVVVFAAPDAAANAG